MADLNRKPAGQQSPTRPSSMKGFSAGFVPIVERELRAAARKKATYVVRVLGTIVAFLLATWVVFNMGRFALPGSIGARLFNVLADMAFVFCLLPGIVLTADCVSEEKREGTIGFLFLTPLRSYEIIAGKLIGNSLNAVYTLLAVLPVLAIPLVLGGVTGAELFRTGIVLLNTMFLSLTTGIFVSSLSRRSQPAMLATAILIIGGTYLFVGIPYLQWFSPRFLFHAGFYSAFIKFPGQFFGALIFQHSLAWLGFILASFFTARTWRESPHRDGALPVTGPDWLRWVRPIAIHRREPLGDGDPADWLVGRGQRLVWIWS